MIAKNDLIIVVTGATGLQGSAVTRQLLKDGWHVRALTRHPKSEKAQALSASGAQVVQGDMEVSGSLTPVFEGAYGVYSLQNPYTSGVEGEINQGKNVADAARKAGVAHLVYGSAGIGVKGTGIPSWESKLVIEDYMKSFGLPLTILRPMALMELMTDKKFFPAVGTWHIMPMLMGSARKVPWLCAEDLGYIVARVLSDPEQFIGKDLKLASDVHSLDECKEIYREVMGESPSEFSLPFWIYKRFGFAGQDTSIMWRWLREHDIDLSTETTRTIYPDALSVRSWLEKQKNAEKINKTVDRVSA